MMSPRNLWPALLLAAAAACADQESAATAAIEPQFEFAVPILRQLSNETTVAPPAPETLAASYQFDPDELSPEQRELLNAGVLIATGPEAGVGFYMDRQQAYGEALGTSRGSFYENKITLSIWRSGQQIASSTIAEFEDCHGCSHFHDPWGETAVTAIPIGGSCGNVAKATATHTARFDLALPKLFKAPLFSESKNAEDTAIQPDCGFGRDGYSFEEDWFICFWEDVYDWRGDYVGRRELGCQPLNAT
jgi:alkylhydroperoxidase/carboxymuconolactone decarboxylase family protein YurZ